MALHLIASVPSIPLSNPCGSDRNSLATDVVRLLGMMLKVRRERRQLMALDESALKDLGLSCADVHREATRKLWDLPRCRS